MITLNNLTVAIHHTPGLDDYPTNPPFHPPEAYPEYPFNTELNLGNPVYKSVRETLQLIGLDRENLGSPEWNPLGELIHPGDQVLIKPNLVKHFNADGYDVKGLVTHGSIVRAVMDYATLALRGKGRIIVGDAPLQNTDLQALLQATGLDGVLDFYRQQAPSLPGIQVEFIDFRLERAITERGMVVQREKLAGAQEGYQVIDLGSQSYLDEISQRYNDFRVTDYDQQSMVAHHNMQAHQYLIPRAVLESDVVINLPKLKTHRKVGITVSLKNLVGINGHKDWLPHHTNRSIPEGGDEYLHPSQRKRLDTRLDEKVDTAHYRWQKYLYRLGRLFLRVSDRIVPYPDPYKEGSWWGNDTLWRTALDLNHILFYTDKQGQLNDSQQRRYLSLVDGILAGEGEGPLEPSPRPCGLFVAGFNPVLVDSVCARIMGFDPDKVPLIHNALLDDCFYPPGNNLSPRVVSNEKRWSNVLDWQRSESLQFRPSRGWVGHIEL
jgi:uncharacterized protein (DUF362 family)